MSTIASISTAPGIGGIGIIRMSGEKSFEIIEKIFKPRTQQNIDEIKGYTIKYGNIINSETKEIIDEVLVSYFVSPKSYTKENIEDIKGYSIKYGNIVDKNGKIIDEVLVSYFKEPRSYTTENMCEINTHGGTIVMRKILEICLENGAVLAEPGEFTKRAFLNGRMDLTQAESVIDILNAKSEKESNNSIEQLKGRLSEEITSIRKSILNIMADIEASIDYPEYDIEEVTSEKTDNLLKEIDKKLEKLENSFETGKILRDGVKTAIIGRPNAGKSSLLNYLLNEERAIVTDIEGTTRDTIEEFITINGVTLKIIDTAGIRYAGDAVEQIGVKKAIEIAKTSDIVIALFDRSRELNKEDKDILELIKDKNSIIILNKSDLESKIDLEEIKKCNKKIIEVSIKNNFGMENIYEEISKIMNLNEIGNSEELLITNIRHKNLIKEARENLKEARNTIEMNLPIDIISSNIKEILESLGKITGEEVTEDVINEIFSKFCLGK